MIKFKHNLTKKQLKQLKKFHGVTWYDDNGNKIVFTNPKPVKPHKNKFIVTFKYV